MPPLDLLLQHLIHHLMLLNHTQPLKPLTLNLQRIHRPTPPTNILHLARKASAHIIYTLGLARFLLAIPQPSNTLIDRRHAGPTNPR